MNTCNNCLLANYDCVCNQVDRFFEENRDLMNDLERLEEDEKSNKRCLACYFAPCRCVEGLNNK